MSFYDFELDLYTDNANADIIKRIRPGSEILEFGPAYGRMTKYLAENLKCAVDIVEIDPESGNVAAQYARQACVGPENGNIESSYWTKVFAHKQYDAIIFTDVLEHLHDPQQTLKECRLFLKEDGCVLCSIPNIAHSSIILSLFSGRFNYTKTGLLDQTHIHFFTEESFLDMISACGYYPSFEHAIIVPADMTEIPITYTSVGRDVESALRRRPNNEAYQFIFELRKNNGQAVAESTIVTEPAFARRCICYCKEELDPEFCDQKKMYQAVVLGDNDISFSFFDFPDVRAVRFILVDSNSLIQLHKITVVSDEGEEELKEYTATGFSTTDSLLCYFENDSEIYLWLPEGRRYRSIRFQYSVLVCHSDILSIMGKEFCEGLLKKRDEQENTISQISDSLQELTVQNSFLKTQLDSRTEENKIALEKLSNYAEEKNTFYCRLQELTKQLESLDNQKNMLFREKENLSRQQSDLKRQNELMLSQHDSLMREKEELGRQVEELSHQKEESDRQFQLMVQERQLLTQQTDSLSGQLALANNNIAKLEASLSWKITKPFRIGRTAAERILGFGASAVRLWDNTLFYYRHYGLKASLYRVAHYKKIKEQEAQQQEEIRMEAQQTDQWERLSRWIDTTPHDFIDIFPVPMGWNTPLFQRFQHLSLQAGNAGGISFYGAHPSVDTDVKLYKFVTSRLCIVNLENPDVTEKFWQVLDQKAGLKYLRIQSIDLATDITRVENFLHKGYQIVYEYIDELTPQITGNIPDFVYKRHEYMLRNEDITVVATSDKLYEQVKPYRDHNMLMLNNGVDYEHWHLNRQETPCPDELVEIVSQGKIIVGYHGALAQWIDYDLLNRIALDQRYILLLIGYEHDGALKKSRLLEKENVYYIGSRSYQELNRYAIFYDIAILPFLVNDITLSVSPVKIFEYMAAGKPVVTYSLPECKKYASCLCADTQEEFLSQLDRAILLRRDPTYLEALQKDALDNTWLSITRKMLEYVKRQYAKTLVRISASSLLDPMLDNVCKDRVIEDMLHLPKYREEEDYRELTSNPYQRKEGDCKIIAYYLTQFHPDPHNEQWWGKGVTEWNNVCRAVPQYVGHYQPRLPGELGFYDLRIVENMKRQIELAHMYGIYGFSFYYYWFDGERLLEQPLEMFLNTPELDFPFSLCWANENWTKRFDGTNQDVLMEQPNTVESYKNVICDMARFLQDPRYIQVDGRKMLTVYRPSLMPQPKSVLNEWRDYCREQGLGELYIIAVKENMVDIDWLKEGYDALSEFHPGTLYTNCRNITSELKFLRKDFGGEVYSYADIVLKQKYFRYDFPKLYRAVMPMWDNTARRDYKGMIFHGSTPSLYKRWLKDVIQAGAQRGDLEDNIIFINAWNEWGEGAYLEPDKRYGYAYLEATKEAVEECADLLN